MSIDSSTSKEATISPFLRCRCKTGTGQRQDSNDYLLHLKARIVADYCPEDSNISSEVHLGDIRATLIRLGRAANEGFSFFEIFDESQELLDLGSALFRSGYGDFVEPVQEKFPYSSTYDDILYISDFMLQPVARGQRAGISALHRFMTDWESGCSMIAIHPLPMQFLPLVQDDGGWPELQLASFTQDRSAATASLENHLAGVGFKKVDQLPYMLFSPARMQAPLEEMALEESLTLPREDLDKLVVE